jgi:hypothetical protein
VAESHGHPLVIYIKATVVVFVRPSVCLAGQGRASRAGVVVSVRPSVLQGRVGQGRVGEGRQGDQTFSVTLRIMDFWPRSGFENFDLLLLLLAAVVSKDHWPKVTGTHGGLHSGLRPRAPTSII